MAANVLKQVKRRKPTVVVAKAKAQPVKTFRFGRKNPFHQFMTITLEEMSDCIDAFTATIKGMHDVSVMHKLKTSVPASLLYKFFGQFASRPTLSLPEAYDDFRRVFAREIKEMHDLLDRRNVGVQLPTGRIRHNVPEPATARLLVNLKYGKVDLDRQTKQQLRTLARREGIPGFKNMMTRELVAALMAIQLPIETQRVGGEYRNQAPLFSATQCESEMKRAPWMNIGAPIDGLAVKPSAHREYAQYATKIAVGKYEEPGWFKVTKSFYELMCSGRRKFVDDAVAYVIRGAAGNLVVESEDDFDRAQKWKAAEQKAVVLGGHVKTRPTIPRSSMLSVTEMRTAAAESFITAREEPEEIVVRRPATDELAPGLFTHLHRLVTGVTFYCDECNTEIPAVNPPFKSVHGGRRVMFCGKTCFEKYGFSKRPAK